MQNIIISGIGPVQVNPHEATSEVILKEYKEFMAKIQEIFDRPTITDKDYQDLKQAMQGLKELAENGDSTSNPSRTYYLDQAMIMQMNLVFGLLKNQGISVDDSVLAFDPLESMRILKESSVTDAKGQTVSFLQILEASTEGLDSSTKLLSELIRYDFIGKGNKFFLDEMLSLEDAIELSNDIMTNLKNIQQASNQFTIPKPHGFAWPPLTADHIPPEIVENLAQAIYKNNPAGKNAFIEQYRIWQSLPENHPEKYSFSNDLVSKVTGYVNLGITQEIEILNLVEAHFKTLPVVPNPGITPRLQWPISSLFEGKHPFSYPLSEEMVQELRGVFNDMTPGYGDKIFDTYQYMVNSNRAKEGVGDFLIGQLHQFMQRNPATETQFHQVFQKYFDQLHSTTNSHLISGEGLLKYAEELEAFIEKLEQPPINLSRTDNNSLAYSLDKVAKDIYKQFEGVDRNNPDAMAGAMARWLIDNRNTGAGSQGGVMQDNLQKAITAAQSLSDTKWNDIQEVKKMYDEFIKVASSLMDTLKKSAQKFTQGISH